MADPFATLLDLETRWRIDNLDQGRAQALLVDASALLRAQVPDLDARLEDEAIDPAVPRAVVCSAVRRAMSVPNHVLGVTQAQQTAGPFSGSVTFSNPAADLYFTRAELRAVRAGRRRAFTIDTVVEDDDA